MYLIVTGLVGAGIGLTNEFLATLDVGADVECGSVFQVDTTMNDDIAEVLGRIVACVSGELRQWMLGKL